MRIFSKFQNLSNEKSLIQQFNALNQEMDLLKLQLGKVNQLLNDTISDKCKHELIYQQQHQSNQNKSQSSVNESSSLFRASLVPVGNLTNSFTINDTKSSSIWKLNSPSLSQHSKPNNQSNSHFSSTDNLLGQSNNYQSRPNLTQAKSTYHAHHHQYYLNSNSSSNTKLNEANFISKSIDSIYSPGSSTTSSNKLNANASSINNSNGFSAFNSINTSSNNLNQTKKTALVDMNDDCNRQDSFQPVNFTSRPKQLNSSSQQQASTTYVPARGQHFKRDFIAEKKRSSIGKCPQNYYVTIK